MVPFTTSTDEAIKVPPVDAVYQLSVQPDGTVTARLPRVGAVTVTQKVWGELAVGAAGSGLTVKDTPAPLINKSQLPNGNLEAFTLTTVGLVVKAYVVRFKFPPFPIPP